MAGPATRPTPPPPTRPVVLSSGRTNYAAPHAALPSRPIAVPPGKPSSLAGGGDAPRAVSTGALASAAKDKTVPGSPTAAAASPKAAESSGSEVASGRASFGIPTRASQPGSVSVGSTNVAAAPASAPLAGTPSGLRSSASQPNLRSVAGQPASQPGIVAAPPPVPLPAKPTSPSGGDVVAGRASVGIPPRGSPVMSQPRSTSGSSTNLVSAGAPAPLAGKPVGMSSSTSYPNLRSADSQPASQSSGVATPPPAPLASKPTPLSGGGVEVVSGRASVGIPARTSQPNSASGSSTNLASSGAPAPLASQSSGLSNSISHPNLRSAASPPATQQSGTSVGSSNLSLQPVASPQPAPLAARPSPSSGNLVLGAAPQPVPFAPKPAGGSSAVSLASTAVGGIAASTMPSGSSSNLSRSTSLPAMDRLAVPAFVIQLATIVIHATRLARRPPSTRDTELFYALIRDTAVYVRPASPPGNRQERKQEKTRH